MGIVGEMRAAIGVVDALPEGRRDDLWMFLKASNGSPFFRFGVEPPGSASLLPVRRSWLFMASIPGRQDYEEEIAPIATDGPTIVSGVARAFWRLGTESGHPDAGLLLQAFVMGRSSGDSLTLAGAGEALADSLIRDEDYRDALAVLTAAHDGALRVPDGATLWRIEQKLAWVTARVPG